VTGLSVQDKVDLQRQGIVEDRLKWLLPLYCRYVIGEPNYPSPDSEPAGWDEVNDGSWGDRLNTYWTKRRETASRIASLEASAREWDTITRNFITNSTLTNSSTEQQMMDQIQLLFDPYAKIYSREMPWNVLRTEHDGGYWSGESPGEGSFLPPDWYSGWFGTLPDHYSPNTPLEEGYTPPEEAVNR
jgi:hypothetical protein